MLSLEEEKTSPTRIKVIGIGGGGMNAVNRMVAADMKGVEFLVINTDEQVLKKSPVEEKLQIGQKTTRGMGAGGDPEIGQKAAVEDKERIASTLKGADMVFVTAGMGGGTGTGGAPILASVAKESGALTVGVITMPFTWEGNKRHEQAMRGLEAMRDKVDALITIKNDSIFKVVDRTTPIDVAFRMVDDILLHAVKGISDLINKAGLVNVDFADVRAIMGETGDAIMGAGEGLGEKRVADAVNQAINNALLEDSGIEGATGLLINICGGYDLTIGEWREVGETITAHTDRQAKVIMGVLLDEALHDRVRVTVIATGIHKKKAAAQPEATQMRRASVPQQPSVAPRREQIVVERRPQQEIRYEEAPEFIDDVDAEPDVVVERPVQRLAKQPDRPAPPVEDDLEIPAYLRRRSGSR